MKRMDDKGVFGALKRGKEGTLCGRKRESEWCREKFLRGERREDKMWIRKMGIRRTSERSVQVIAGRDIFVQPG